MSSKKKLETPQSTTETNSDTKNSDTGNTVAKVGIRQETEESNQESYESLRMARKAKQHKKWNRRLKIFFCCLGYKKNKVIRK